MTPIEAAREKEIQDLRRAMGTLPSEAPPLKTTVRGLEDSLNVNLVSCTGNPYTAIFEGACATWGDDQYALKWSRVSPANRFKVCLAALTGQTLPQALEVVTVLLQVVGTPRWLFEEHAREMSQFTTYFSVGCRDNSKLDASMVITSPAPVEYLVKAKDNYRQIIEDGHESWQSARSVLPMSYHHPYLYATSLLALMSNFQKYVRRSGGSPEMSLLLHTSVKALESKFPLIGQTVRGTTVSEEDYTSLDTKDRALFEEGTGGPNPNQPGM